MNFISAKFINILRFREYKNEFLCIFVMIPGGERSEVPWKQKKIR